MAIKKNETNEQVNHRTILKNVTKESKAGRKSFVDEKLKADKRNTFLLNEYQQIKMEKRMQDLGFRNKSDYIISLLKKDIIEL